MRRDTCPGKPQLPPQLCAESADASMPLPSGGKAASGRSIRKPGDLPSNDKACASGGVPRGVWRVAEGPARFIPLARDAAHGAPG